MRSYDHVGFYDIGCEKRLLFGNGRGEVSLATTVVAHQCTIDIE
jgi:hypothetical protein